jgi:DNA (cytosine-5)-methyltransferase 1
MTIRVWAQVDTGFSHRKNPGRWIPGFAHPFEDRTDCPFRAIMSRPRTYVLFEETGRADHVPAVPGKPAYQVPSMPEIAGLPWNGFTAASTFSGCGGSSLGYRMAGFRVAWASEFVPAAAETYRANASAATILDTRDIREVTAADVLATLGMEPGELDLFDGSPPCASFSTAGSREKHWGQEKAYSETAQRTDDLFFEYVRLVDGIRPRVFVAENVSGLVKGTAKGYFKLILAAMRDCGYQVQARLLNAAWLGVPQARQRLIFIGVRDDLGVQPVFPSPLPYQYTVRDALPWIVAQGDNGSFGSGAMRSTDRPSPTFGAGTGTGNSRFPPSRVIEVGDILMQRGSRAPLEIGAGDRPAVTIAAMGIGHVRQDQSGIFIGGPAARLVHDTSGERGAGDVTDRPAPTITTGINGINSHHYQMRSPQDSPAMLTHDPETGESIAIHRSNIRKPEDESQWGQCRKLTLGELRRLSGFPDDFVLTGKYLQRWERIGRAVPPVMMSHIAATVRDGVLQPLRDQGVI